MRLAWLFDVDGTLIRSFGTAREAFSEATRVVLGVEDGLENLPFAGGLDPLILASILHRHGRTLSAEQEALFWEIVHARTARALESGRSRVLPGVPALLEAIGREPRWINGLLTGNRGRMARLKLGHFGLNDCFAFGAFGDEAPDRDTLARLAVTRIRDQWGVDAARCVVVGDTENDIRCARAAGARVVAVTTGTRKREDLEPLGPDLLLDDLRDTEGLLDWARGVANGAPN